ncbi:hypothetical protein QUF55_02745 [Clostridiaceae bacterium HSG29]|nr:hypothetical protein [Clostridiaceae bacterium HSG29]
MFNLIKYDWIRKWIYALSGLVVIIFINIGIYFKGYSPSEQIGSLVGLNMLLFFISSVVLFVLHVRKMNKLLFSEEGQFTFLTPLNGYEILGANLIGALLDIIMLLVMFLTIFFVNTFFNDMNIVNEAVSYIHVTGVDVYELIMTILVMVFSGYSMLLVTIFLSMILVKTLFYNIKAKKILSFVVFIFVSKFNSMIAGMLNNTNIRPESIGNEVLIMSMIKVFMLLLFWYGISGYLLEKKVSA